ncbi:Bardet-Biedl syndrome 10 protein isoform X2 [Corythoichthys intestinalis]|nr:Bardet-Biedl syndrome 10 protein isoform X2 [Corythoichthys intestinalis]XP_061812825.1 Bardet-Biedl syndrome 10 protein homolog [Nerophis lumbriciformis]
MSSRHHLHQKHVLQIVCALETIVLRTFGPEGGQVLFTRDNGHAMLSRSGTCILTALRLEHPLARMIVECVWKHSRKTGDGSKSFILLLASLLRAIYTTASKESKESNVFQTREAAESATAKRFSEQLVAFALEKLEDVIAVAVEPNGLCLSVEDLTASNQLASELNVKKLLVSFFLTRLGFANCDLVGELTFKLLAKWSCKKGKALKPDKFDKNDDKYDLSPILLFLNDHFPALHTQVSSFPVSCSRLIDGQVIHRDFATHYHGNGNYPGPAKAVVFTIPLQPKWVNERIEMEIGNGKSIVNFSAWAESSLERIFATLQTLGVSVLLSAVKQSDAFLTLATQAEMAVVECISKDELALFIHLSRTSAVTDSQGILPEHVASLEFCRPILLGAHRYVHVAFPVSMEEQPCNIVICGLGEEQTDQYASAIQDVFRMLHTTWEPQAATISPGCVIPAGGTFELILHHALLQQRHCQTISKDVPVVCKLLANGLLHLPQQIHADNPRLVLQIQSKVWSFYQNIFHHETTFNQTHHAKKCVQGEREPSMYCSSFNSLKTLSGLESVSCKYHLILAVLQCVKSLLRLDTVFHIPTELHPKSPNPIYSSEDED